MLLVVGLDCQAERIRFFSAPNQTNQTSSGQALDHGFAFELGVFANGFVPSQANVAQWAANWRVATDDDGHPARDVYNPTTRRFDAEHVVTDNHAPFTVGAAAYVWGFRGGVGTSEWILFRKPTWTWPAPNPLNPLPLEWDVADAVAEVGSIDSDGSPSLMRTAAVAAASPATTWQQWRAAELAGTAETGPADDPDRDGLSNLLEYVFGSPPTQAGPPPTTALATAEAGGQAYLQLSVPRRIDHVSAVLAIEVSDDLTHWFAGPGHTVVVGDTPAALVARDATVAGGGQPCRFMRLRASLP